VGPKAKLKQKFEENAMKKYANSKFMATFNKTDRVDDKDIKKLLNIVSLRWGNS
jgi:hypothetical protein